VGGGEWSKEKHKVHPKSPRRKFAGENGKKSDGLQDGGNGGFYWLRSACVGIRGSCAPLGSHSRGGLTSGLGGVRGVAQAPSKSATWAKIATVFPEKRKKGKTVHKRLQK